MTTGQRVSFRIGQATAYGTVVSAEIAGSYLVAIDAQYVGASAGQLRLTALFAAVSLAAVAP